jgi:4-methylaminobutanoate oxidase (formaldehyde-forming)
MTAWHLVKNGVKNVVLIEKNTVGSMNTSKAASVMTLVRTKEPLIPLIQETYRNIEEIGGEKVGQKKVGTLHIAASEFTEKNLLEIKSIAQKYNINCTELTPSEMGEKVPWLDCEKVTSNVFTTDDSYVDAYLLANAFAQEAKKMGLTILQNTEVTDIILLNDIVQGVQTGSGFIKTDKIIDTAGAWANILASKIGIQIPMAPVRSIYWITEKNPILFPQDSPMLVIPDANAYTRPESGALLFGLREENSPHFDPKELNSLPNTDFLGNPDDRWDIIEKYGQNFISFFPKLPDTSISSCITGISTYTPDGYYNIGALPQIKGFYVAAGCAGAGVAGSGGIGRLMSEMVRNEPTFVDVTPFALHRFGKIDPFSTEFRQSCADARGNKKDGG